MSHYIAKCKECKTVISQCRCMDHNKLTEWVVCDNCQKGTKKKRKKKNEE